MKVFVSLYTILKRYGKDKIGEDGSIEIADGSTNRDLSAILGIPPKPAQVYLVNQLSRKADYVLEESDSVKILSFIGGG